MNRINKSLVFATASAVITLLPAIAMAGEITWWTPNWGEQRARKLVADFEKVNPDIKINIEVTTSQGLPERVLTALQSGAAPDIIEVQHAWVQGYAQSGLVLPVDDLLKDKSDYNKAAINYVTYQDHLWGVPYRVECIGLIYNAGDFTKAGLDPNKPPQTWDDWTAAAKALTRDGTFGMAITAGGEVGNTITRALPLIWMNGGDIISADGKKATLNTPEAVAAVKYYTDFFMNGFSPDSTLQNDGVANRQLFIAGKVAMYQSGQFDIPPIKQGAPDIKLGATPNPHPVGKNGACILSGWSYVIPKDAKNPTDAKKFIQFMDTTDNQAYFTDTFPARVSSLKAQRFQDPLLKPFGDALADGRPAPNNPHWVQISQAFFDGIQRILTKQQDVQTSVNQTNDEIQSLLDQ